MRTMASCKKRADSSILRARYYNPRVGTFIQIDNKYDGEQGEVATQNRYAYSLNNPYKYVDRDGEKAIKGIKEAWYKLSLAQFKKKIKNLYPVIQIFAIVEWERRARLRASVAAVVTGILGGILNPKQPNVCNDGKVNSPYVKNWDGYVKTLGADELLLRVCKTQFDANLIKESGYIREFSFFRNQTIYLTAYSVSVDGSDGLGDGAVPPSITVELGAARVKSKLGILVKGSKYTGGYEVKTVMTEWSFEVEAGTGILTKGYNWAELDGVVQKNPKEFSRVINNYDYNNQEYAINKVYSKAVSIPIKYACMANISGNYVFAPVDGNWYVFVVNPAHSTI